ncbi:hypothetical protein ElyMa_001409000 [Elysia marginata]|uniref:Uncharacterized protein n=1 Tax=Elysia marginata TaxID=1093978 RepID=A0AAV4IXF2_9GAST|nr:hypothetical protein ElyMa_001409000 [Elysia marginata]
MEPGSLISITNIFYSILQRNPQVEKIIVWSDGCSYQNKYCRISNVILKLCQAKKICIEDKYLLPEQIQMDCDSMHCTIERNMNHVDQFASHDSAMIMQLARKQPGPYEILKEVSFKDCCKRDRQYVKSIRPGKEQGDPTVFFLM